jgi:hypothetical protein
VIAQMSGRIGIANAERIQLSIDGGCCHVFDTSGRALIRRGHMSHAPAPARRS